MSSYRSRLRYTRKGSWKAHNADRKMTQQSTRRTTISSMGPHRRVSIHFARSRQGMALCYEDLNFRAKPRIILSVHDPNGWSVVTYVQTEPRSAGSGPRPASASARRFEISSGSAASSSGNHSGTFFRYSKGGARRPHE